jgi:hypothetical protein
VAVAVAVNEWRIVAVPVRVLMVVATVDLTRQAQRVRMAAVVVAAVVVEQVILVVLVGRELLLFAMRCQVCQRQTLMVLMTLAVHQLTTSRL